MADRIGQSPYLNDISNPVASEVYDLERQKRIADLLTQKGMETPQGQIVGGRFVKPSWSQYANQMLSAYLGGKESQDVVKQQQELANKLREQGVQETQGILQALSGTPAQQQILGTETANLPQGQTALDEMNQPTLVQPAMAAQPANPQLALSKALMAQTPMARTLLPSVMERAMPKDFDLTEGQVRFRINPETGKPEEVARGAEKKTNEMRNFEFAKANGFQGSFDDYQNRLTPYQKAELGLQREKFEFEKGKEKTLTESQSNATAFGVRAKEADMILKGLEGQGYRTGGVFKGAVEGVPWIGGGLGKAFNWTASDQQQATTQARKNFVTAILRKESGASISSSEFENEEKKYFPQVGDSDATVLQKQKARETAVKALELQAGPGAKDIRAHNPSLSEIAPAAVGGKTGQPTLRYNPATGQLESVK